MLVLVVVVVVAMVVAVVVLLLQLLLILLNLLLLLLLLLLLPLRRLLLRTRGSRLSPAGVRLRRRRASWCLEVGRSLQSARRPRRPGGR